MTEQNKERKRLAEIHRELSELIQEIKVIEAKYRREIWSSKDYEQHEYNNREKLRNADFTIRLAGDQEYQVKRKKRVDLEAEKIVLEDSMYNYQDLDLDITGDS